MMRKQQLTMASSARILRCTGVDWDLRKAEPYSLYSQFEFDVPLGTQRRLL